MDLGSEVALDVAVIKGDGAPFQYREPLAYTQSKIGYSDMKTSIAMKAISKCDPLNRSRGDR